MSSRSSKRDESDFVEGEDAGGEGSAQGGGGGGQWAGGAPNVQDAIGELRQVWDDVTERLDIEGRIDRNPIGTVLAAAGIGFVLGGGVFRPLAGRLIGAGLRLAILPILKDQLYGLAEPYVSGLVNDGAQAFGARAGGAGGDEGEQQGEGGGEATGEKRSSRRGPRRRSQPERDVPVE
ncbi:MAG TPA: hypothetical protein VHF22_09090 [Planctomycetota bacterium]|nr:hypothetical protein [Planctomycetota bacterium]